MRLKILAWAAAVLTSVTANSAYSQTAPEVERPQLVVVLTNVPPLSYVNAQGDVTGQSIDFLNLMAEREGWDLTFQSVANPSIALEMLEAGEAHIHPNLSPTDQRREVVDFTDIHTTLRMVAVVNSANTNIRRVDQVDGLRFEYVEGAITARTAQAEPFFGTPVASNYELIGRLLEGRSDGAVQFDYVFNSYQAAGEYRLRALEPVLRTVDAAFAVSRLSPVPINQVNAAYAAIATTPEVQTIRNFWLPPVQFWTERRLRLAMEVLGAAFFLLLTIFIVSNIRRKAERQTEIAQEDAQRDAMQFKARQQDLMIQELNHRVRNIITLIRSVSRQARYDGASLDSYSAALEKRIQAIAAAHDLGATSSVDNAVSIKEIIETELAPYTAANVEGEDRALRAEMAPIFALVVHELATNAVKYGALSRQGGTVSVSLHRTDGGFSIVWQEDGGPEVPAKIERQGFGSTLIRNAIPHEMNGTVEHQFDPKGVRAHIWLPDSVLGKAPPSVSKPLPRISKTGQVEWNGGGLTALVVEDNFIIAEDLKTTLQELGCAEVVIAASVYDALDILEHERIDVGFLDMNLGKENSFPVARRMQELKLPFYFASGYGEDAILSADLKSTTILPKPVERDALLEALMEVKKQGPSVKAGRAD